MKDAVYAWGHQLLLRVSKVTRHILGNENNAALSVDNKEKSIKGLVVGWGWGEDRYKERDFINGD